MTVIMIHTSGCSWDDSACDDHIDVKNAAARGTTQLAMVIVIHKIGCSLDDSACDDNIEVKNQLLVGRFKSQWLL